MKLQINLATRQYINLRPFDAGLLVVGVLLLVVLALNVYDLATAAGESRRLSQELAGIASKGKSAYPPVTDKDWQRLQADIASANAIIRKKAFNWLVFLDTMETVLPDGVTITSLEPKAGTGELKLSGAALSFGGISALLANMENSRQFADVYLLSQAEQKFGQTQKGIVFSLTCKVQL